VPDYINWYLVELRLRLQPYFGQSKVEAIVSEVESHLCETSLELRKTPGMTQVQADLEAVRAFGEPQRVATSYLQESNPKFWGLKPLWVVLSSGLIALACWVFHWISLGGYFDNFGATWQNGLALVVGLSALSIFTAACRAGHRSYFKPLLGLGFGTPIGLVLLLSFWVVGSKDNQQGFSRFHLNRDIQVAHLSLKRLDRLEMYLQEGISAFSKSQAAKDLPLQFRDLSAASARLDLSSLMEYSHLYDGLQGPKPGFFIVPSNYVSAYVDGRIWGVYTEDQFSGAKRAWSERAIEALAQIGPQREGLKGLLASAKEAQSGRLFFFNSRVYSEAVVWAILFMPILLFLNSMAFRWGQRRPVWPARQTT